MNEHNEPLEGIEEIAIKRRSIDGAPALAEVLVVDNADEIAARLRNACEVYGVKRSHPHIDMG